jgi:hypothetical protein
MSTIIFGRGGAQANIPETWLHQIRDNGEVVVGPPEQDIAFLWLSTLSWDTPDRPDFSPAGDYLSRESSAAARIETRQDAIIAYAVRCSVEDGMQLASHQFQVIPKRAVDAHSIVAFLTLSVKHDGSVLESVRQMIEDTWSIARTVVFNYKTVA